MDSNFSSSNNATNRRPKGQFAAINYNEPDPNIVPQEEYEKRYFLMLPREREQARRNELAQGGLITDKKYSKTGKQGELVEDIVFTPPYPKSYLTRLSNSYEFDSIVRTGIDTLVHYILGRDFEPRLRPVSRDKPRQESEYDEIIDKVIGGKDVREKFLDYVNLVDHQTKLKLMLKPMLVSKYVFGRAASLIVKASKAAELEPALAELGIIEDTPMHIKPLNSYYLSQNHYDTKTWEVTEIEYDSPYWVRDPSKSLDDQPALSMDDLLYFTHADYNIIPNSYGYGMSALENILALSGANRRINEKVLPELNTMAWAGTGIFKFVGMSAKQMSNFVKNILPSTWKATNQELDYIPIKLDYNGDFILNQRDSNVKHIATQLRIPSFLINFEDVTNRSIGDRVSNIWQQGDLEFARDELRDQLWETWYRRLMELFFPEEEFLYLKAKILIEFQSIDFSNFFEKAIAAGNLIQNNIWGISEAREFLGSPPFPEDQQEYFDNIEKYLLEHPQLVEQLRSGQLQQQGMALKQEGQQFQQDQQKQLQKQGINISKVRSGNFGSSDLLSRAKRQAKTTT